MKFDGCDDALWVENDGVFRQIDFERMKKISWGNKNQEADTTGAFGIGFISVYQITDAPEIFSSGEHWVFHPEEDEKNRILVDEMPTERTRFRLPWAFKETSVRRELQIPPVNPNALEKFTKEIVEAIEHAALFLRQLTTLEVRRNGESRRKIEVVREENQYLIADGEKTTEWRIFRGDFGDSEEYQTLRKKFDSLLQYRRTQVEIAVPEVPSGNGLLYAFLPSETNTGLPFHINADFFPSPDRKRILLGDDYKSDWNRLALECAAQTLARNVGDLLELYPDLRLFWEFASQVQAADENGPLHGQIPAFWKQMQVGVAIRPTVLTASQKKMRPRNVFYPRRDDEAKAAFIFEELGLPTVHEGLRKFQNLLTSKEIGVNILRMEHVLESLKHAGFDESRNLAECPPALQQRENWPLLWMALESLGVDDVAREQLHLLAIAFGKDSRLYPPVALLFENDTDVCAFFSAIAPSEVVWMDARMSRTSLPGSLVPPFDLERGLHALEQHTAELPIVLQSPEHLATLYAWLASQERQLRRAPAHVERIKALPIGPLASGAFKPLDELYLTGDFEDPLQLAGILDTSRLPGRKDFVREILGLRVLDLKTYVAEQVPRAWNQPELGAEKRKELVRFLSKHLGELKGGDNLKGVLSRIPLVLCDDGEFRLASETYFNVDVIRTVMGKRVALVDEPFTQDETIRDFYTWLGVSDELRPADLLAFVQETVEQPPDPTSIQKIVSVFQYLVERWSRLDEETKTQFALLKNLPWLPGSRDDNCWFPPDEVYAVFQKYLFESQGNFLLVDTATQRKSGEFIRFLGIKDAPELHLVIRHLRFCSKENKPVNKAVYTTLNNATSDDAISHLRDTACLYIESETGEKRYYEPRQVFLGEHPFGAYRLQLPGEFYQYKKFLDAVGVKETPDYQDAIAVLQEIGQSRLAQSHLSVEGTDDEKVLFAAWEMLNEALLHKDINPSDIHRELHNYQCIPNRQNLLYAPERLLFEDRPGWAAKFDDLIKYNIAPRKDGIWQAMQAAGVHRLSKVVKTTIADLEAPRDDTANIAGLLNERQILLRRVLNNSRQSETFYGRFDAITFSQASKIIINRMLQIFGRESRITESIDAIYLPDETKLYYVLQSEGIPWSSIARELTYALDESQDASMLPLALASILSGPSFGHVNRELDSMGLPPLDEMLTERAAPAMAHALGASGETDDAMFDASDALGGAQPEPSQSASSARSSGVNPSPATQPEEKVPPDEKKRPPRQRKPLRTTKHLISYVLHQDERDDSNRSENGFRNQEIGQRGESIVMAFERREGRQPENMNVSHQNHPGYDIKSYSPETEETRYIEVKALTQRWDGRSPARMTHTEFETAIDKGERYWLYIVEEVESETPVLYCIQNPARQVEHFCYDHGWMKVSTCERMTSHEKGPQA